MCLTVRDNVVTIKSHGDERDLGSKRPFDLDARRGQSNGLDCTGARSEKEINQARGGDQQSQLCLRAERLQTSSADGYMYDAKRLSRTPPQELYESLESNRHFKFCMIAISEAFRAYIQFEAITGPFSVMFMA